MAERLERVARSEWEDIWLLLDRGPRSRILSIDCTTTDDPPRPRAAREENGSASRFGSCQTCCRR